MNVLKEDKKTFCIPHSRPTLGDEEKSASARVIESGMIAMGKEVEKFEKMMAGLTGLSNCKAVTNGTTAIQLALLALGVQPEDEVILPSYCCTALLNAVLSCSATPVIVDIEEETFNLCIDATKKAISPRTKAILLPHMFGTPALHTEALSQLDVPLLEDCAQALGASINGRMTGSFGKVSILSFYATKLLTTGEGGMVCSMDEAVIQKIEDLREYDKKEEDFHLRFNAKMTDIQGAIGQEQLMKYPHFATKRREIAARYTCAFSALPQLLTPPEIEGLESVYYRYIVLVENRDSFIEKLAKKGISAARAVPHPLHHVMKLSADDFPHTENALKRCCSIPIYPSLTEGEMRHVIATIEEAVTT